MVLGGSSWKVSVRLVIGRSSVRIRPRAPNSQLSGPDSCLAGFSPNGLADDPLDRGHRRRGSGWPSGSGEAEDCGSIAAPLGPPLTRISTQLVRGKVQTNS